MSRTTTELHTGQIWREVDPRLNREVEILGFPSGFDDPNVTYDVVTYFAEWLTTSILATPHTESA